MPRRKKLSLQPTIATHEIARRFIADLQPRKPRTLLEFAQQEIVIPTGEYKGSRWRPNVQPWSRLLFEQIGGGHFTTFVTTGPSQSGKTQSCFAIPALYTLAELRENFVLGVPDADMADKKWRTDLQPIMEASPRLRELLPSEGSGSRGGRVRETIQFNNSVVAALMSQRASDAGKAGFTARCVHVTEAGAFSVGQETSEESDPLRQLKARQRSYSRSRRRLFIEGTVVTEEFLPWRLRGDDEGALISSRSILATPCPHCNTFISPEREHFVGWQDAETEDEACNEACFICPQCSAMLTDDDRRKSNQDIVIVHDGQSVNEQGEVVGDMPPTSTLWFRYSQWNNLLLTTADLAEDEWKAAQLPDGSKDRDDAERELCQFQWCMPYRSLLLEHEPLESATVRKQLDDYPRNIAPEDTEKITVGVDVGDWTGWFAAIAHRSCGIRNVISYGCFDVKRSASDDVETRLLHALHEFAQGICNTGWMIHGSGDYMAPSAIWIDGGYLPDTIAQFVLENGKFADNVYKFARGRGQSSPHIALRGRHSQPMRVSKANPYVGKEWFASPNYKRRILQYTFNADFWKLEVHQALRVDVDAAGALVLFRPDSTNEHAKISNHFCNEQLVQDWEPEKGRTERWVRKGENHWLDCVAMALAAGDQCGYKFEVAPEEQPPQESDEACAEDWCAQLLQTE